MHDHCIAHLVGPYIEFDYFLLIIAKDISHENVLMNHHGIIPDCDFSFGGDEGVEFRSTFPMQYLLVDFGFSSYTHLGPNSGLLVDPLPTGRPHRAPESVRSKFDPFAADVYQTARLLYAWTHVRSFFSDLVCVANPYRKEIVPEIPGLLELLQDMSYFNPKRRISMSVALVRLQGIHTGIQYREVLHAPHELDGSMFPMIPMRHWSWLLDAVWLGQFSFARKYFFKFRLEL